MKSWLWRLASLLKAKNKFNCGITGLRKAKKILITLTRVSTTDQNNEAVKKIILDNGRTLLETLPMVSAYRTAHASNSYRCFRLETCGSEVIKQFVQLLSVLFNRTMKCAYRVEKMLKCRFITVFNLFAFNFRKIMVLRGIEAKRPSFLSIWLL